MKSAASVIYPIGIVWLLNITEEKRVSVIRHIPSSIEKFPRKNIFHAAVRFLNIR